MAPAAQQLTTAERRARVVELVNEGKSFTEIGNALGVTKQRANAIFHSACAAILSPALEAVRARQLAELEEARETVLAVMRANQPIVQQGHIVSEIVGQGKDGKPEYGDPLVDQAQKLDAARALTAVHAREAKLLGADAATKIEAEVSGQVDVAAIPLVGLIAAARLAVESEEAALKGGET